MSMDSLIYAVRDIIEASRGCGGKCSGRCACYLDAERIVALVASASAAAEREACLAVAAECEAAWTADGPWANAARYIGSAIRARTCAPDGVGNDG